MAKQVITTTSTNIVEEKFSLMKFFSGFGNVGKILFIASIFFACNLIEKKLVPRIESLVENQKIETYIEAPKNKPVYFYGFRIHKVGFGFTYEK